MENTLTAPQKLSHLDDDELIARTQAGDTEAFTPIVQKYQQKIYNLIYRRVRNHETAEDLCQEVFLKAWRALPKFQGKSAFYSWLYQIAINYSIDFLRKQNRQVTFAAEDISLNTEEGSQIPQMQPSPHEILEQEELKHIIQKAARQLPPGQHEVFRLRYEEELSIKEIAAQLDKSEGTIKAHLHHAHNKLRKTLYLYLQNETLQ